MKPFRWNIKKREQLGCLVKDNLKGLKAIHPLLLTDLTQASAQIMARSQGRRIVFVGRSPENFFDYLSGVLEGVGQADNIALLNISNRFRSMANIQGSLPASYSALKAHFESLKLSPKSLIDQRQGIVFCDLVATGGTFEQLFYFLKIWALEEKADWPAVMHKIAFLGITQGHKTSPNTWRWQQHSDWVKAHPKLQIKNLSIPWALWDLLGNRQNKVSQTNRPESWGDDNMLNPPRDTSNLEALQVAYGLFELGVQNQKEFPKILALCPEINETWLRSLSQKLKG